MSRHQPGTRWPWREHLTAAERRHVEDHEQARQAVRLGKQAYAVIVQRAVERAKAATRPKDPAS